MVEPTGEIELPPRPSRIILASGSKARRDMLRAAGIEFDVIPPRVNEDDVREQFAGHIGNDRESPARMATFLAMAKALEVAERVPGALIIGADQVLHLDGSSDIFTKPRSRIEAREQLKRLAGRKHWLTSVAVISHFGEWPIEATAALTMRQFSDAFLDDYLDRAGEAVLESVGCYQLEGLGIQLFERIEGDYFTILGMPLLPLLAELRWRKVIPT